MMDIIRNAEIEANREFFKVLRTTERSQLAIMDLADGEVSGEFGTDHPQADQILIVLGGSGELRVQEVTAQLSPGDVALIRAGEKHQVTGPCRTLNVYAPVAYPDEG